MRTITCTSLGSVTAISVGTTYSIISETGSRYTIINDKGVQANYGKNLFSAPVEVREEQVEENAAPRRGRRVGAAAAGIPNAVPAPRVLDHINVNTSVSNPDGAISFKASFEFGNNQSFIYSTGSIMEASGISASCGIQSLDGIDSLGFHVRTARLRFNEFVAENAGRFSLSPDLSIDELFTEIPKAWIQDLVGSFQGEEAGVRAGLLIASTTENSIAETPELRSALDEISVNSSSVSNPNSGNQIVTWSIPVEA